MLKKFQPDRQDILINTDWGEPRGRWTPEEARSRRLVLFHDRWVSVAERKQLRDEANTYQALHFIGIVMMLFPLIIAANYAAILRSGATALLIALLYALALPPAGYGLVKYRPWSRIASIAIFASFLVLPFLPPFEDDKGAPLLIFVGVIGLNYLLRGSARRIYSPEPAEGDVATQKRRTIFKKVTYAIITVVALAAGYFSYDLNRAARLAADACSKAKPGTLLAPYLAQFGEKDYRIIRRADSAVIVPRNALGRSSCTVSHDGQTITGAKAGLRD
jgi:hypothetical protein